MRGRVYAVIVMLGRSLATCLISVLIRDPGLDPDFCSVLEARATILASRPFWRLTTGVRKDSFGRGACVEGRESVLRGITAGGIGLWRAGI